MDRFLIIASIVVVALGMVTVAFPDGAAAILVAVALTALFLVIFRRYADDKEFVTNIFLVALLLRLTFGIIIHVYSLREFFGGDALTYDFNGAGIVDAWMSGGVVTDQRIRAAMMTSGPGWGMNYLVAFIYFVFGRNILAAQSFCGVIGAATAPMVYFSAKKIFGNIRVAKISAVAVAVFPAFIIWSSQLLKDGLIIFLLVLAMTMVLQLQHKFNYAAVVLLILSLFGIMSLRFYIFYMVAIAVAGSFIIGVSNSAKSIARRTIVLILMGLGLTYFGVIRTASVDIGTFGNLEALQNSRLDLATSAVSGFGADADVSTSEGAISALPIGFAYLMFAPFPWEVSSLRQAITLPEVLLWWMMMPVMIYGIWYTIKHRLRTAFPILIFSLMLTMAYSIFLGNMGTAYRQRAQIQVFLFIFLGVGWTVYREHKEDEKTLRDAAERRLERALRGRME